MLRSIIALLSQTLTALSSSRMYPSHSAINGILSTGSTGNYVDFSA